MDAIYGADPNPVQMVEVGSGESDSYKELERVRRDWRRSQSVEDRHKRYYDEKRADVVI